MTSLVMQSRNHAISIRGLSKCYQLGTIGRHTLVDEVQYLWHKIRGRDPREHMARIGHGATEARRVEAEEAGGREFWALRDVSFDVQPGEVVGIIGRNGAGKSTLLKLLTRITEPTSGEAEINGRVGSLLEVGTGFHPELTGRENVYMNGAILGMKTREIDAKFDEIVEFSGVERFIDTPVKRYSSGMYVRLAFAVAAHLEPEILLVDEVLAVGDAAFQKKCLGKMDDVARQGRTIFFVSHNMAAVQNLCTKCLYLMNGQTQQYGPTESVIASYLDQTQGQRGGSFHRDGDSLGAAPAILAARVRKDDGTDGSIIRMGQDFKVEMTVGAPKGLKGRFAACIVLLNQSEQRICALNTVETANLTFSLESGRETLVCHVRQPNLLPGVYKAIVLLQEADSRKNVDMVADRLSFEVIVDDVYGTGRTPRGSGVVYLRCDWMQSGEEDRAMDTGTP